MGFLYNDLKKDQPARKRAPGKAQDIPIKALNDLGCSVCPRDDGKGLRSPKMAPSGAANPLIYLLGTAPSPEDDEEDLQFKDKAGEEIIRHFGRAFKNVRVGHITQCATTPETSRNDAQLIAATECCRKRVVADIEATKPLIVVGVGDAPLKWATGLDGNALRWRGTFIAAKFGSHVCWYLPVIFPNYVHKKRKFGISEYELAVHHDIALAVAASQDERQEIPEWCEAPYDEGIEYITGQEPGDMQRLEEALLDLARRKTAIDIETADYKGNGALRPHAVRGPRILMCSVSDGKRTVAFNVDHPDGWGTEHQRAKVWLLLGTFIRHSKEKVAHNLAMEMEWFEYFFGPELLRLTDWGDTMAMAHTFDERPGTKALDVQIRINFGFFLKEQSRVDSKRLLDYPVRDALRYNALDAKWTARLAEVYRARLATMRPNDRWEYERKVRLAPTLILTESFGLPVDFDYTAKVGEQLRGELKEIERKLFQCKEIKEYEQRYGRFSPTNPDHALLLLRDVCKRPEAEREDRDGIVTYSSDEEVLSSIPKDEMPSASLILEHRGPTKLIGTYIEPILEKRIVNLDGRMRTKYSSMVAVTGRLNSEGPNLQNFPKRKRKEVRGAVYAGHGLWIVPCDYGQIEFRVVGMASEDENLVKYCWTKYDVHKFWAERIVKKYPRIIDLIVAEFGIDWDEKGIKTLRQEAKNKWVFPQLFGSSTRSCAAQLHLPEDIAEDLGAEFWDEFPQVKRWQEKLLRDYEKNLYVETLTGRRRRGPQTKNEIINHPIQGTAGDIVLEGMCAISERAQAEEDWHLHPRLNIHDDLTFWLPDEGMEQRISVIAEEMCKPRFDFINVPLIVEVSAGQRWHECEPIAEFSSVDLFNLRNPYA